jgi:hypothetical protein
MHSLSPWSKSIPGELLSSRAHFRFDFDMHKINPIFFTFNPSSLWEAYNLISAKDELSSGYQYLVGTFA